MKIPEKYWEGKALLDARLPWLTPGAIKALDAFVNPTHTVLELGGGGSTLFFADRCKSVLTWEPSLQWRLKIYSLLGDSSKKSVICDDLALTLQSSARESTKTFYDIVLSDNSSVNRLNANGRALDCVKRDGWFILDNYGRYSLKFLDGWRVTLYDDPHWDGKGTLIATRF